MHENSMTLSHEPDANRAFSPFQPNPPFPQADPSLVLHEKEKYKAELRQQMEEKKQRDAIARQRKQEEGLKEEERLKREREELLRQYQENGSERQKNNEEQTATGRADEGQGEVHGDGSAQGIAQKEMGALGEIREQEKPPLRR